MFRFINFIKKLTDGPPTVHQLTAVFRLKVGQQLADSLPTFYRQFTDSLQAELLFLVPILNLRASSSVSNIRERTIMPTDSLLNLLKLTENSEYQLRISFPRWGLQSSPGKLILC